MIRILKHIVWNTTLLLLSTTMLAQNNGLLQANDIADTYRIYQLTDSAQYAATGLGNRSFVYRSLIKAPVKQKKPALRLALNEITFSRYYNDSLGTGYNNGSFFQATGWQERITIGATVRYGKLQLRLQPELVLAQNKVQAGIDHSFSDGNFFSRYYFMNINVIDLPSRFGTDKITRVFPGQSSIRYFLSEHLSAGLSTENLWWGPGIRNALVMSNQAPGFLHATIQTHTPLKTGIGHFEGQLIYGWLDSSGIAPIENVRQFSRFWQGAYEPKISQSNRNIAAMILSWQPKWAPNLYIGFAASRYFYTKKTDSLGKPFPDYPYTSSSQQNYHTSMGSLFFRYAMPGDHAEVYAEFGRGDKPANPFNLFGDTIPTAYTAGLRKLVALKKKDQYIELAAEITHLALPDPRLIFTADNPFGIPKTKSWYTHPRIRQGYTHQGQLLGAGIGPGSNSQTIHISWVNGSNKIGVHAERVVHNEDFYYYSGISGAIGAGTPNRHWTDLSFGLHGQYTWKQFRFAGAITKVSALNYQWVKVDGDLDGPSKSDKLNTHIALTVSYAPGK